MTEQRATGSFYTDIDVAQYMANWAIRKTDDVILEPSFGDGVFLDAAISRFEEIGAVTPDIYAVELQKEPFDEYNKKRQSPLVKGFCQDFMRFDKEISAAAVIGNPPYIRLRHLTEQDRAAAMNVVEQQGVRMLPSGSLWMAFIMQAAKLLALGGRIGFVLPFEITYVRYAYPLWNFLAGHFGKIGIYRVHEDFFPDVDVETVLFLAEEYGNATDHVEYVLFETCDDLYANTPLRLEKVMIADVIAGKKPFLWALLEQDEREMLDRLRGKKQIVPISEMCKFRIGYVCADKDFFHPSQTLIEEYDLPPGHLVPCVSNAKAVNGGTGIGVVIENGQCQDKLYVPRELTAPDRRYIARGENSGVHKRYKCRIRKPWYVTPGVERADIILTVFGDIPKMLGNLGEYAVSNSLLCGTLTGGASERDIICRWYNSLTLLSVELNIHSLGGGVLVFIPGETDKIEVLREFPPDAIESTIAKLSQNTIQNNLESTYLLGDEIVLKELLGFSDGDIALIRKALATLRHWRRQDGRRSKGKEEG